MSERARSRTRFAVRAAVSTLFVTGTVFVYAACGLSVSATGGGEGVDGSTRVETGGPALPDAAARNDGSSPAQSGCAASEVMCGADCADLTADPKNCGVCGKACGDGQTCADSKCTVLCVADKTNCNETCVDLTSDPAHCGTCERSCGGLLCQDKSCVANCTLPLELCGASDAGGDAGTGYCADKENDRNNCGACGKTCQQNEVCSARTCTPVCVTNARIGDVFGPTMVGCVAKVEYSQRGAVCPAGTKVCSGQDWVNRHGTGIPTYNYWTNDDLRYAGQDGNCTASTNNGTLCGRFTATPMRVCGKRTDAVGNACRWIGCGFGGNAKPSQYFGGCEGNTTAGALCCKP